MSGVFLMLISCMIRGKTRLAGLNLPLALFMVWCVITVIKVGFSLMTVAPMLFENGKMSDVVLPEMFYNSNILNIGLFAFLYCVIQKNVKNWAIIYPVIITATLLSIYGIIQVWYDPITQIDRTNPWRVSGLFGNPNDYIQHLAISIPFFLLIKRNIKWLFIILVLTAMVVSKFVLSGSFSFGSGLIALPFGIAFYLYAVKSKWVKRYLYLLLVLTVGLYFFVTNDKYNAGTNDSFQSRMAFTEMTLKELDRSPLSKWFGWGFGMYKQHVGKVIGGYKGGVLYEAHNEYLQMFTELGYIGLILFGWILIDLCRKIWLCRNNEIVMVFTTSLFIAAQISVVNFPMHIATTGFLIFVIYSAIYKEAVNGQSVKICV